MFKRTLKTLLITALLSVSILAVRPAAAQDSADVTINRAIETLNQIAQLIDSIQARQPAH